MICDDCLTAAYDELGAVSSREEQQEVCLSLGGCIADHLCEETAGDVDFECDCASHEHQARAAKVVSIRSRRRIA